MAYTTINDPSAYFQTALYTGTGSTQSITNDGNSNLKPDWVWVKSRSNGGAHNVVFDSSRGVNNRLITNLTIAEDTGDGYGVVSAFNTDGFTVNPQTNLINVGGNGYTYVAWQWKANGGTTTAFSESGSNPGGTRQTNTDAGFSIISYTGTGSNGTIAHGLPSTPEFIIFKRRDATQFWCVWHQAIGDDNKLALHLPDGLDADGAFMASTLPTSTNITVGGASVNTNADNGTYICYAFSPIQGYSKFGKYVGNGNADGPFIYTGFKPRFIMIKSTTATGSHVIWDSKRSPFNGMDDYLVAAEADAEGTNGIFTIDALSNGFKIRNTGTNNGLNQNATKYVYYAFAENPLVTSTGTPTTAR
jgi:hypothetical protein